MKSPVDWALTPIRRYADFTGRSTRSELAFFYLLTGLIGTILSWVVMVVAGFEASVWASLAYTILLACPWIALGARRLQDTGRSGWWLLLAMPGTCQSLWDRYRLAAGQFRISEPDSISSAVNVGFAIAALVVLVLLLLPDQEDDNRYGPNPRYGEREMPAEA